ncbi:3-isopropylmalate/(R)-2-methylmalate dehydratase small subunit [Amycolatopsis echigonensis]|uniref:3-isopropylmalate dehydratase small subunit n=1 Tax=Amycolatopsis echigonensis TaxID=2576905 RepID=A0A2N3X1K3_9PSEU|nr:3-isopropylmalate dehydratase [Amycolatopsis niigatensis]PKW00008.1 3-isopropylmalate/(R)-2-methylmalate dehydratase small subunit [Amycolatopsis niigatensis]
MSGELVVTGRAWVFGDGINTDDMYPGFAMRLPLDEAARHVFHASRPGWPDLVRPGDIVVAGRNFGLGSSRPVPLLFRELGVAALVAEQFNSLFFRNCVNYGLPAATLPDATKLIEEGETVRVDFSEGSLEAGGTAHPIAPLPELLRSVLAAGGLFPQLEAAGKLRPAGSRA